MPGQRYASNAERQRAYRERKRAQLAVADLPARDRSSEPAVVEKVAAVASSSLEAYVADAVFMAELHHGQASPQATLSSKSLADAIDRAELYARWRYREFLAGEVGSL